MTPDALRKAEHRFKLAMLKTESAREDRNRLVREALASGWTHAQIAEATGLSRGRVSQIR